MGLKSYSNIPEESVVWQKHYEKVGKCQPIGKVLYTDAHTRQQTNLVKILLAKKKITLINVLCHP